MATELPQENVGAKELTIDGLIAELTTMGKISEAEPPVVTRVVFGEADLRARAYVKGLCAEAGLTIREDPIGNTFARWVGTEPELAPVGTGDRKSTRLNSSHV